MNKIIKTLTILCILVFLTSAANAQLNELRKDIQLTTFPKYPGPHESVRVEAQSFSFDIRTTPFTWLVDDVVKDSGIGKTSFSFVTKNIGASTKISLQAKPANGIPYENSIVITPSHLDVSWLANSYTPPWYRGKALPSRGSLVTVTALPMFSHRGSSINPSTMVYDWWLDNKLLKNESGRGKNFLPVRISSNGGIIHSVRVRVEDATSGITQEKSVEIPVQNPKLLFYELDPLRGPHTQKAILDSFSLSAGSEAQFLSVPYFMNSLPRFFSYTWSIDGTKLDSDKVDPTILIYRSEPGASGRQTISLTLENPVYILEQARESFQIIVQ